MVKAILFNNDTNVLRCIYENDVVKDYSIISSNTHYNEIHTGTGPTGPNLMYASLYYKCDDFNRHCAYIDNIYSNDTCTRACICQATILPTGPTGQHGLDTIEGATGPTGPSGPVVLFGSTGPMGPNGKFTDTHVFSDMIKQLSLPQGPRGPRLNVVHATMHLTNNNIQCYADLKSALSKKKNHWKTIIFPYTPINLAWNTIINNNDYFSTNNPFGIQVKENMTASISLSWTTLSSDHFVKPFAMVNGKKNAIITTQSVLCKLRKDDFVIVYPGAILTETETYNCKSVYLHFSDIVLNICKVSN